MGSTRRYSLTKQDLIDNGYFVEGEKVFKHRNSKRSGHYIKEIKQQTIINKNKYGNGKSYIFVPLHIKRLNRENRQLTICLHTVIYAWYKGEVPLGYDVDHIDNNSLNNNINNLQLLTHEENIRRRKLNINQWYYIKEYDDSSWSKRQQELINKDNNRILRKELKPQYDLYIKILEDDIKKAKESRDFKTWHELINKRITFTEYFNKYKEDMEHGKEEKE